MKPSAAQTILATLLEDEDEKTQRYLGFYKPDNSNLKFVMTLGYKDSLTGELKTCKVYETPGGGSTYDSELYKGFKESHKDFGLSRDYTFDFDGMLLSLQVGTCMCVEEVHNYRSYGDGYAKPVRPGDTIAYLPIASEFTLPRGNNGRTSDASIEEADDSVFEFLAPFWDYYFKEVYVPFKFIEGNNGVTNPYLDAVDIIAISTDEAGKVAESEDDENEDDSDDTFSMSDEDKDEMAQMDVEIRQMRVSYDEIKSAEEYLLNRDGNCLKMVISNIGNGRISRFSCVVETLAGANAFDEFEDYVDGTCSLPLDDQKLHYKDGKYFVVFDMDAILTDGLKKGGYRMPKRGHAHIGELYELFGMYDAEGYVNNESEGRGFSFVHRIADEGMSIAESLNEWEDIEAARRAAASLEERGYNDSMETTCVNDCLALVGHEDGNQYNNLDWEKGTYIKYFETRREAVSFMIEFVHEFADFEIDLENVYSDWDWDDAYDYARDFVGGLTDDFNSRNVRKLGSFLDGYLLEEEDEDDPIRGDDGEFTPKFLAEVHAMIDPMFEDVPE
jgi:hypothetical protein